MTRAVRSGDVLADSDDALMVGQARACMRSRHRDILPGDGDHCSPAPALRREHFREDDHRNTCPWKGVASCYDVVVGVEVNPNAAWYNPQPKDVAKQISGRVALWKGVRATA